jgi:hypothetical protein
LPKTLRGNSEWPFSPRSEYGKLNSSDASDRIYSLCPPPRVEVDPDLVVMAKEEKEELLPEEEWGLPPPCRRR